ncbi:MAG: epoxyqueuosine reductase QueH [Desulfobacteraceae bacterium]|nr:epoxyqueuosine reductase QueH [Desulfobacteraceae bacterium]
MHLCCGPCTAYPLTALRGRGHRVRGFFFNPNIHPYREFRKRLEALEQLASRTGFDVEYCREYGLREYLRRVVFQEERRCRLCYEMRLAPAAERARAVGAEAFTTTLLYSRYQNHALIREVGEEMAARYGIPFYYEDFREGWQQGIDMAIAMELYRQPYCGCIYSEEERYDKRWRRKRPPVEAEGGPP